MKTIIVRSLIILSAFITPSCEKNNDQINRIALEQGDCIRGTLVKKGMCGQLVVKIISEKKNEITYASSWKDESTGKTHENVFTVENSCAFPNSINEGGEFYFKVTSKSSNDCVQCAAFTPVPKEKNSILVSTECGTVEK